jgi:hypothetical protein
MDHRSTRPEQGKREVDQQSIVDLHRTTRQCRLRNINRNSQQTGEATA